jgi:hypothetical protein
MKDAFAPLFYLQSAIIITNYANPKVGRNHSLIKQVQGCIALTPAKNPNLKLYVYLILIFLIWVMLLQQVSYAIQVGWYTSIENKDLLAGFEKDGINIVLPYDGAWLPEQIGPYLDEAQVHGIKVWVDLRLEALTLSEKDFRNIIRAHRDYPALFGWYISDEPEYGGTSAGKLQMYYNYCKQEDPNHPVAIAHANVAYSEYVNGYDWLLLDFYPGYTLYDPHEFNWMVRSSFSRWENGLNFARANGKKFVAVGLGFGAHEDGTDWYGVRDLTYAEYRYHVFSAIVQGVDGFLFWSEDWTNSRVKPIIDQMIGQVNAIDSEMRNGTTNDRRIAVSQPAGKVIYRYGVDGSRQVILAVNIAGYDVSDDGESVNGVRFTLPDTVQVNQVEVLNEDRTLPVNNHIFTDDFDRFAVHAYRFTTSSNTDSQAPSTPTNLEVSVAGFLRIDLLWTASTDHNGVAEYKIYRDNYYLTTVSQTSFSDTNLNPSTTYTYEVSAVDASGNESIRSAKASATTRASNYAYTVLKVANPPIVDGDTSEYSSVPRITFAPGSG